MPLDEVETAKGIAELIRDNALKSKLIENLHIRDYGNEREVDKIYELL